MDSKQASDLRTLDASYNAVGNADSRQLTSLARLQEHLLRLELMKTQIGDRARMTMSLEPDPDREPGSIVNPLWDK